VSIHLNRLLIIIGVREVPGPPPLTPVGTL